MPLRDRPSCSVCRAVSRRAGLPRHRPLLLRPLRGRAAQARLAVPVRLGAGQHTLPAGGADGHRPARVEDAPPLAQPGDVPLRRTLEARVGQIVQGDGGLEETRLDRVAVAQQAVAGAVRGVPAHGLAVAAEQLTQGAALAQPVPRGAFGGRRGHAADEVAENGGALCTGQAQLLEQGRRTELPHGPQGDALDADRARADQLQGVDFDSRQGGRRAHGGDAGLHQLGGAALGLVLDRGAAGSELEGPLGGEDALDAGAQRRPAPARQGEVTAEVAQGALAHPEAGADEAVGEVGLLALGAGTGGGPADEQAPMGAGPGTEVRKLQAAMALHWGLQGGWPWKTNDLQRKARRIRPKSLLAWRTWAKKRLRKPL